MFNSSALGTKQYWESFYETEIHNFNDNGDVGEIWFGKSKEKQALAFCQEILNESNATIMDIGCGNGHLSLFLVKNLKIRPLEIYAIDYSAKAVELCQSLMKSENLLESVHIEEVDMTADIGDKWIDTVTIAIDKGTYDAVSLCPDDDAEQKKTKYRQNLSQLVKTNGYLLIFSCNWTESELVRHFNEDKNIETTIQTHWSLVRVLPSPSFSFGGMVGKNVTAVVFQKK